jgi:tetratricopeptide (TPR) repeat protein
MKILFILTILSTCLISQDVGYKLYKDGEIESALEYYQALIQLDNDDISREDILYNIGTIYSNMDSISEAGSIFQQAYHDSLDFSSDLSYNYGNVLYRGEQLDKSLEAYKNTLLKNPNDSDARKNYEFVKNKIKKNKNMEKQQDQNQDSKDNEEDKSDNNNSDQNKNQNENEKDKENNSEKNDNNKDPQNESPQVGNNQNKQMQSNQSAENILNALKENEKVNKKRKQKNYSQESNKDW